MYEYAKSWQEFNIAMGTPQYRRNEFYFLPLNFQLSHAIDSQIFDISDGESFRKIQNKTFSSLAYSYIKKYAFS